MLLSTVVIFSLLLLATVVIEFQLATDNTPENRNNRMRIRTWWLICATCIPLLYVGEWAITLLVYMLIYLVAFELSGLLRLNTNIMTTLIFASAVTLYGFLITSISNIFSLFYLLPITIFLTLLSMYYLHTDWFERNTSTEKWGISLLVLSLCTTSIFSIEIIRQQSDAMGYNAGLLILFLLFITSSNDIFQYITGRILGRVALAPRLSKHKTVEGALGGIVLTTALGAFTLPFIINTGWLAAALTGTVIAASGIAGDLNISYLKRQAGVKDAGSCLPGHGGLLDRIDSLLLSAPVFGLCLSLIAHTH